MAMEKISLPVSRTGISCLVIVIFLSVLAMVLVPAVRAEGANTSVFDGWNVVQTGQAVHVDLPSPPFSLPDAVPDTTFTKGDYDKNGCPIGMIVGGKEAPRLRDAGFASGALCRGACGPDCPTGRCKELGEIAIENREKTGTCWYYGVIECPTHTGCQEHDSCYDYCEVNGYHFLLDSCHRECNGRCFNKYGYEACIEWADLPGRMSASATKKIDKKSAPHFAQTALKFSYPPDFRENPLTLTPTTPTPTTSPVPVITTTILATTPVTTTTTGPDATLTLIWTGTSQGDAVNVEPQAGGSCGRTEGQFQCSGTFPHGTKVTLTAIPNEGSKFVGWFRGCSGTGACTLTMDRDRSVEAEFMLIPVTTAIVNYQEYCTTNYPGSVYDREEQACVFHRETPTPSATYATSGGLTLIPLAGGCCPDEPCSTQIATATGGTPPYTFTSGSLAAGSAPPMGMIIDVNGYLTGTAPSRLGPYSLGVCVKDLTGQSVCGESSMVVS